MMPLPDFFRSNRWFFSGMAQLFLFGGLLLALMEQGDFVWFFNRHRSAFLDFLFVYGTKLGEPIGFILAGIGLLFVGLRYVVVLPLAGFSTTVVSYFTKSFFAHDRPLAYFERLGLSDQLLFVEGVKVHSGATSFPSGHTMAGFALFAFLAFCIPQKKAGGFILFLLALVVGLSRIYLVQHFFKDVYLGAVMGVVLAMLWYALARALPDVKWLNYRISA